MAFTKTFRPETLQYIADKANHMTHITSSKQANVPRPEGKVHDGRIDPDPVSFSLPPPPSLIPRLLELGLSSTNAAKVDQRCSGYKLKETFEREMRTMMRHWMQTRHEDNIHAQLKLVHEFYTSRYFVALDQWHNTVVAAVHSRVLPPTTPRGEEPKRSSFDQDALSILELAFEKDAYPTRDMKIQIAAQTGIEHKQVNVWFQNRRNRYKKQHKELRSAKFKHERTGSIIIFSPQCALSDDDCSPVNGDQISLKSVPAEKRCDIATKRPSHAFPSPYPPVCSYEPFPTSNLSFETRWSRRQTTEPPQCETAPVEVDQLALAFAKLTTVDVVEAQEPPLVRSGRRRTPGVATCYNFIITPPKAPLPALVPATVTVTSSRAPTPNHRIAIRDSQTARKRIPSRSSKRYGLARDGAHPYRCSSQPTSSSSRSTSTSSMTSLPSSLDSPLCTPPTLLANLPRVKS